MWVAQIVIHLLISTGPHVVFGQPISFRKKEDAVSDAVRSVQSLSPLPCS